MVKEFTHMHTDGTLTMVDVGHKRESARVAVAGAIVEMNAATLDLLKRAALPKGDVLTTAKIAGIMAAKRTSELIPLCHPVALDYVDIRFAIHDDPPSVRLEAEARCTGRTGVEMEALVAAQVAAAAIYDMCKAVQKDIRITDVRLLRKSGGKSGEFFAP
jgi:cyclic pyranopterin phosphate synthase